MKRRIFLVCLFCCFFRLPIYESIAAIFWQSASYVAKFLLDRFDFPSDFYALDFLRDLKLPLNHNFKQLYSIGGNLILKFKWKVRQNCCHFHFKS